MMLRLIALALAAFLSVQPALAQWQVPTNSIPFGRGVGQSGFNSVTPGSTGQVLTQPTGAAPAFSPVMTVVNAACSVLPSACQAFTGYFNVAWFGNSLQAAVNAANPGGTVFVPPGTYTLASALAMQPGVTLQCGQGATITQGTAANLTSLINFSTNAANGASLLGCTVDGNRVNNTDNLNAFCVLFGTANDVTISGNVVQNCSGYGIEGSTGQRPRIVNNKITNTFVMGIAIITGVAQTVTEAFIHDNVLNSPLGQHAIGLVNSDFASVRGNIVAASLIGGPSTPMTVTTSGTTVTAVSGPNFANVSPGMFLIINSGLEFLITAKASNTSLTVNTTPGTLTGVPAVIGEGDLLSLDSISFATIANNRTVSGSTGGIVLSNFTGGESAQKNIIQGNIIELSGEACISTQSAANGTQVFDNTFNGNTMRNCAQSGTAGPGANFNVGMNFVGAQISNELVANNYVRDDQGSPTMGSWMAVSGVLAGQILVGNNGAVGTTNQGILGGVSSVALSAGWGTGAATSGITTNGHSVRFTITAGTSPGAQPNFTVNGLAVAMDNVPLPQCKMISGTGTLTTIFGEQNSTTGATIAVFNGTPVASATYQIQCNN